MSEELKAMTRAKRGRCKARITRCIKDIDHMIKEKYAVDEFIEFKDRLRQLELEVMQEHDNLVVLVDTEDEKEEAWITEVETSIRDARHVINVYMKRISSDSAHSVEDSKHGSELVKLQSPKLPQFDGSIREYITFKEEFKAHVNKNVPEATASLLLRNSLGSQPRATVRGLGCDYNLMWKELDATYGNARQVSDAILSDIDKFRDLKVGEDKRFIEFVNLVRSSYQVLKQVGRPSDLDNNAMLSRIEQKLTYEMKIEWSRHLDRSEIDNPTLLHLQEWLLSEKRTRIRIGADVRNSGTGRVNQVSSSASTNDRRQFNNSIWRKCWICDSDDHWVDQCLDLKALSVDERWKKVKDAHACYACLKKASKNHTSSNCNRRKRCTENVNGTQCYQYHHPLLHSSFRRISASASTLTSPGNRILPVVTVKLFGRNGSCKQEHVLLDSGAELSIIREDLAQDLQLMGKKVTVNLTKVGGKKEQYETKSYTLQLHVNGTRKESIEAIGLPSISDDISEINLEQMSSSFGISLSEINRQGGKIGLLLGVDYPHLHVGETKQSGNLIAKKSPLGWIIFGKSAAGETLTGNLLHVTQSEPIDLITFWSTESLGTTVAPCTCESDKLTREERKAAVKIRDSAVKVENRWQIGYPWCKDPADLPDNRLQIKAKMLATERKLYKDPHMADLYCEQMSNMVNKGISRKLSEKELVEYKGPIHYISHHAVKRPDSISTPIRIVFNSSSQFKGHRLNDYWDKGPDLLNNLIGVILRFREYQQAFVGDISRMFHQILIPEQDQHAHRYLWRNMDSSRAPDTFVMKVVSFGDKPSPAIAITALILTAEENENEYPEVAYILKRNVYMDDICHSVFSSINLNKLLIDVDAVLKTGGFTIKQWNTNANNSQSKAEDVHKILGLRWNPASDILKIPAMADQNETQPLSKRMVLGELSKVFDPLGFCAPVVVRAKIAMQELWKQGIAWDEPLSRCDVEVWRNILDELSRLSEHTMPRSISPARKDCLDRCCGRNSLRLSLRVRLRPQKLRWLWQPGIKWIFSTPSAPHTNGVVESLVKSCKYSIKKAIGETVLRPFELYAVLLETGNLVNQRPIGRHVTNPDDGLTLCPNDLLLGRSSSTVPQGPFRSTKNPRERFLVVQQIVSSFWTRWTRDTFPSLVPRKKWNVEKRNVQVGDVVIMADSNNVRGKWTIGRLTEVFAGKDDRVRNVRIKTNKGNFERPVTKIVVISPVEELLSGPGGCFGER